MKAARNKAYGIFTVLSFLMIAGMFCGCAHETPKNKTDKKQVLSISQKGIEPYFSDEFLLVRPGQMPAFNTAGLYAEIATASTPQQQKTNTALNNKKQKKKQSCSLGDRFDRGSDLALMMNEGHSRLGLDVELEGMELDNAGQFEVQGFMLRFDHKFQKGRFKNTACLYPAAVQGLVGSVYNELWRREDGHVLNELEDKGLFFWRQ